MYGPSKGSAYTILFIFLCKSCPLKHNEPSHFCLTSFCFGASQGFDSLSPICCHFSLKGFCFEREAAWSKQLAMSPTFYEQLLHQFPFIKKISFYANIILAKRLQTQTVSTLNLRKTLSNKKSGRTILVKLFFAAFLYLQLGFVIFWQKLFVKCFMNSFCANFLLPKITNPKCKHK